MKETKIENMKEIEELIENAEGGYPATIIEVTKTTSEDFFGKTKYEDREGYEIVCQLDENKNITWSEFFNVPKPLGVMDSKAWKFKKLYGELPKKGLKVKAITVDGNFKIVL